MKPKLFSHLFLVISFSLLVTIFSFNFLIDPYDVTGMNFLNIQTKFIKDERLQKINRIKKLKSIDNLILGSSRSQRLNPDIVSKLLGGYTYAFGISGGTIEDSLGLLLYLEKENKLPKNIILCIDFYAFSKDREISKGFYKIPEINFLNSTNTQENYSAKLFSIDALRASIKTFKMHLKHIKPDSYINQNGYFKSKYKLPSGNTKEIHKVAEEYYLHSYKEGRIEFSQARFEYLKQIVSLSKKYQIKLHVMLTPIHICLYKKIANNAILMQKLSNFKEKIQTITPYYDAMIINEYTINDNNFEDAAHYTENMGNYLLYQLLQK